MEAADDICYHILDLEDGLRLGLIDEQQARPLLAAILGQSESDISSWSSGALRGRAIGSLIDQTVDAFITQHDQLLDGTAQQSLTEAIPAADALQQLYQLNMQQCYRCDDVLGLEQMGYTVLQGLLDALCASAFDGRNKHLIGLLGDDVPHDRYQTLLRITDFVSAMSDRQALKTYRRWSGIAL